MFFVLKYSLKARKRNTYGYLLNCDFAEKFRPSEVKLVMRRSYLYQVFPIIHFKCKRENVVMGWVMP